MGRFFQVSLRTTAVEPARAFYRAVLDEPALDVCPLHEQALARGACPHWLGFVEVADVDASAARFVARGAAPLGPKWLRPDGLEAAVLRDPGGAVLALGRQPTHREPSPGIAWYVLHTVDVERAKQQYRELFGWHFGAPVTRGEHGELHPFSWQPDAPPVGVMSDLATRPGVHPHWLFFFAVDSVERATDAVRAGGGVVVASVELPGGERVAVFDDPQGAAFAVRARHGGAAHGSR